VLNKIDCCDAERCSELTARYPDALLVSAKRPQDVEELHRVIAGEFERLLDDLSLMVPYTQTSMIGEVHKRARVVSETFEDDGVHYQLRVTSTEATRLQRMLSCA
jgi:GTP-binding protein HflX